MIDSYSRVKNQGTAVHANDVKIGFAAETAGFDKLNVPLCEASDLVRRAPREMWPLGGASSQCN
jgi:hypothetical protein